MLNPACTPGWAEDVLDENDQPTGEVVACCGCGWEQGGFASRTKALAAQKEHRFPGPNPRLAAEPVGAARYGLIGSNETDHDDRGNPL
jgi:hypothetical protein